jgi:hypothetical protein
MLKSLRFWIAFVISLLVLWTVLPADVTSGFLSRFQLQNTGWNFTQAQKVTTGANAAWTVDNVTAGQASPRYCLSPGDPNLDACIDLNATGAMRILDNASATMFTFATNAAAGNRNLAVTDGNVVLNKVGGSVDADQFTVSFTPPGGDYQREYQFNNSARWTHSSGNEAESSWTSWDQTDDRWEAQATSSIIGPTLRQMNYDGRVLFQGAPIASYTLGDPLTFNTALTLDTGGAVPSVIIGPGDLTVGACVQGRVQVDTGGATKEWCVCGTGNVWSCWNLATGAFNANGPAD